MILTFILEQFASAANNSQNRVFCAGSTMDVNDVVKAKMWLFFPILDTIMPIMVTTKNGQYFFFFCSILSEERA